ncbi:MAG: HAMP domain-containing histidine kinase [Bacteroidales bacterium]|nr:HAMP domain-containing histidine kinase [Bacteroidales bacterium]MCF6341317.1 HAMP domain-containing histidine kinase [Bacteroidales bacterium]
MNKWAISIIVALVTLSTIGLMIIQVYWIRDAVKVKQAVFFRDVDEAMSHVIFELDRIRFEERIIQQRKNFLRQRDLQKMQDSLNRAIFMGLQNIISTGELDIFIKKTNQASEALKQLSVRLLGSDVGSSLVGKRELIDSLIQLELKKKKINTKFEFGVLSPATNSMILQKTGEYPEELLNESFVFDLSPLGFAYGYSNKLLLYFPNEKRFIVRQLWKLLIVSVFLFLVIILSFSISIYIINKQKRLSVMKNDFINNMTHEFKTPISTIALACEALKDKDVQKSETIYNNYIGVISEENGRLGIMAEQILQTALIDKGQLKLKMEPVDMHAIIEQAVKSKKMSAEEKGGKIEIQFKATRPQLTGDPTHLTNVIVNLLDNALKYNLNIPQIVVNTINSSNSFLVRIQDNGIGISKSNQKKIFDKLYRVPTGNLHDFKGFGLGLSYVVATVELHNGTISVDSELGKGSTFTIQLPII